MNTALIDYCGEKIQEANIALDKARADRVKAMQSGADATAMMSQITGLRERIAAYADVSEQARHGRL